MNRREVFLLVKKVLWLFLAALFLVGCGSGEEKKVQDLEFTVVPERQVPEELAKVIRKSWKVKKV